MTTQPPPLQPVAKRRLGRIRPGSPRLHEPIQPGPQRPEQFASLRALVKTVQLRMR